jgi:acyl transferase domain-containing protein
LPVYANSEAAPYPTDADSMRRVLGEQLARPVRFVEQIEAMSAAGARTFLEVGPGSVLTDLVGRILGERAHTAIAVDRKGRHGVSALQEALGRLVVAGHSVDFAPLWTAYGPPAAEKRKPVMTIALSGINHGKPYPPVPSKKQSKPKLSEWSER